MLRIKDVTIFDVNGISELYLNFNEGFNFICGENGIGKTTILDCIASSFNRQTRNVRKNVRSDEGSWQISGNNVDENEELYFFESFKINEQELKKNWKYKNRIRSKEIINFSINRTSQSNIYYGNQFETIQSWMLSNYYEEKNLSTKKYNNLDVAQQCFTMLDPKIRFSKVEERKENDLQQYYSNHVKSKFADIYVETPSGEIPFNFLSSGYRSCLLILLGIIKQTEVTNAYNDVHLFNGVILIDELDLHLHPEWQAKLIEILKWLVPNAQIIAATHSPYIIQVAKQEEVIALAYSSHNNSEIVNQKVVGNKYGFQGWSIDEVLRDIMGMEDNYSKKFTKILEEFDESLSNFDIQKAHALYKTIDKMLHPNNHLRKILKIQMSSLVEVSYDQIK